MCVKLFCLMKKLETIVLLAEWSHLLHNAILPNQQLKTGYQNSEWFLLIQFLFAFLFTLVTYEASNGPTYLPNEFVITNNVKHDLTLLFCTKDYFIKN